GLLVQAEIAEVFVPRTLPAFTRSLLEAIDATKEPLDAIPLGARHLGASCLFEHRVAQVYGVEKLSERLMDGLLASSRRARGSDLPRELGEGGGGAVRQALDLGAAMHRVDQTNTMRLGEVRELIDGASADASVRRVHRASQRELVVGSDDQLEVCERIFDELLVVVGLTAQYAV